LSCRDKLVASFGRISPAWASMGQATHRMDGIGPHARQQRDAFGGLGDSWIDIAHTLHAKRLAQKGQNITPKGHDITFEGHMVVDDESEHDTWHFEVKRLWMISTWLLEALLCSPAPTTCSICQNILLQGMTSPLF
jgi:hypothetical protein